MPIDNQEFADVWGSLDVKTRRMFAEYAKSTTERNLCYAIGYLAALEQHGLINSDRHSYLMALAGQMAEVEAVRQIILAEGNK